MSTDRDLMIKLSWNCGFGTVAYLMPIFHSLKLTPTFLKFLEDFIRFTATNGSSLALHWWGPAGQNASVVIDNFSLVWFTLHALIILVRFEWNNKNFFLKFLWSTKALMLYELTSMLLQGEFCFILSREDKLYSLFTNSTGLVWTLGVSHILTP